ncbi:ABC transporter permease subunit [Paenibacillus sp. LMG 31456]|uniref:ABC transporter permease subunit n=1 Tax=Paenibacillus foliorum TaxID=2654974 RepID=A0A972GT75_9BACL|nr:sugar ABC transporter permease [Paenibacillus foliorum]NOU93753.1 ABC transporter permease subunit [Paenibacillus foliorum]
MERGKNELNAGWSRRLTPYLLILPNVLIYFIFIFVPLLCVVYLSFTSYSMLSPGKWIGFSNYVRMFNDSIFMGAVVNTIVFWLVTVIPQMLIGLVLAVLLNSKIRGMAVFRAGIYLPSVISGVAVSMTWLYLYDNQNGPFNAILKWLHFSGINWLGDTHYSLMSISILGIWVGTGYAMIIYLAGLQSIDAQLYEAASIDGATGLRSFLRITVPLLNPMTFFIFVTATIRSFQVFDYVYIMTKGGPLNSTNTIVNQIVDTSFGQYEMGYASALSIFLLVITLAVTLINYRVGTRTLE